MAVFRRRQSQDADQPGHEPAEADEPAGAGGPGTGQQTGPWDVSDSAPEQERIDLGSLQVPADEGFEIQVSMAEDRAAWVTVMHGESGLQLQAFAAPKSGGLWDDIRREIAAEVARAGGESQEADGPFGIELRARIVPGEPVEGSRHGALQPVRFWGVDGPRWFLRGVVNGPAASRDELARPFERVFAGVVVVRGHHPVPPRDLLEIRLPPQARQALDDYMAQSPSNQWSLDPFERGPEITETR